MLKIFVGYDNREHDAFMVCAESIRQHTSVPVAIVPLRQQTLRQKSMYWRPEDEPASTEFAFTRFLVPFLCDFKGFSIFLDCDFLITKDIAEMMNSLPAPEIHHAATREVETVWSVACVKHDYVPKAQWKMDGEKQVAYPRKNWSSLMVFNNAACKRLSKGYCNTAPAADLHRFAWMDDKQIIDLPAEWNWLEGEYEWTEEKPPAGIHFTNGGPWHVDPRPIQFGNLWTEARLALSKATVQ